MDHSSVDCRAKGEGRRGLRRPSPFALRPCFLSLIPPGDTPDLLPSFTEFSQDLRGVELQLLHPGAGSNSDYQYAVLTHDDWRRNLRDLRSDQFSPLWNHTCLIQASLDACAADVCLDCLAERRRLGGGLVGLSSSQDSLLGSMSSPHPGVARGFLRRDGPVPHFPTWPVEQAGRNF